MICPNCRNQVVDGTVYCPNCGTNLNGINAQDNVQQPNVNIDNVSVQNNQPMQQQINNQLSNNYQQDNVNLQQQLQQPLYNQVQNNYQKPTNNNKKSVLIPIIIVVILIAVAILIAIKFIKKDTSNNNSNNDQQVQENDNSTNIENNTDTDNQNNSSYDNEGSFLMPIEDIFTISGKGTVATGTIERGSIKVNDEIQIIGLDRELITTVVTEINKYRKSEDSAEAGENVGLFLRGVDRNEIEIGQVIAKKDSIKSIKKFDADVYMLSEDEGGRSNPISSNYQPQFYFRAIGITGSLSFPNGEKTIMPGNNAKMTIILERSVAMEVGTKFIIKEDSYNVGEGIVTKIY